MSLADAIKLEQATNSKHDIGFGGRILLVLEQQRRSKTWLAEKIGVSKQAINYLLNHSSSPKHVNEIAAALEVSPEWLLFGKGSQQFISEQDAGISLIPVLTSNDIPTYIAHRNKKKFKEFTHITGDSKSESYFATILENSSMEPLFKLGTLLIFNSSIKPKNSDYVIFSNKNEIFFRQYYVEGKELYLKATNGMYKSFKQNDTVILGVLVESRNHFK